MIDVLVSKVGMLHLQTQKSIYKRWETSYNTLNSDIVCKIHLTIFYGSAQLLYHSLKSDSILDLNDLYVKLISHSYISRPAKTSTTKLFTIIQWEDKSVKTYL